MSDKLTSIRLQEKINIDMPELELWQPVLRFGKKKSGEFVFPIIFTDVKKVNQLFDELEKLKGKSLEEVKEAAESLYEKYKEFDYRIKNSETKVTVTATVDIQFKDGLKPVEMLLKTPSDLVNCEEGKVLVIILKKGNEYTGFFNGMDDEDVILSALSGEGGIGLKLNWIDHYFEEIKPLTPN